MAGPLRILMLHNRYLTPGGEDVSTESTVDLLRRNGHTVELLEEDNERVADLGRMRTAGRSIWSVEAHRQIESALSGGNFDVMHVQNFFPLFSPSVYYAASRAGVPVVQSLRNFRLLCPEGMLHRDDAMCTDCVGRRFAWPAIQHSCYRDSKLGSASVAMMSATHRVAGTWRRKVTKYVTPSEYTKGVFVGAGWDRDLIEAIPNFVYPDPGAGNGAGGFALYLGRLDPAKGIDTLLETWAGDGVDYPLRIAGDGSLRDRVVAAAAANPNIDYLGQVGRKPLAELVGQASFIVVPTTGIETFGRVVAEAMAKGTPAIAADQGGLSELVVDGVTGVLVPPGNAAALGEQSRQLAADGSRLLEMREAARRRYLERYTGERVLADWERVYTDAMARN